MDHHFLNLQDEAGAPPEHRITLFFLLTSLVQTFDIGLSSFAPHGDGRHISSQ
jgi:hypothetical protein